VLDPTTSESQQIEAAGFAGDLETDVDRPRPGLVVLRVRGEIDALTTPRLESALSEVLVDRPELLVLDLGGVTFLASSGLAVLIRAAQLAAEDGRRLRLVIATRAVRRPLQITGSDQLFDLFDELDAATADPV